MSSAAVVISALRVKEFGLFLILSVFESAALLKIRNYSMLFPGFYGRIL